MHEPFVAYDRNTQTLVPQKTVADGWMKWIYETQPGRMALGALVKRKAVSSLYGWYCKRRASAKMAQKLIDQYDVRSGQGPITIARSMSGGNQQKAIVAREIDKNPELLVAVQPTRGLDVGAIEYIHKQLVAQRDAGKAVLLVSLELDEVMDVPDRILVMYEGEIVGQLDPKTTTQEELGLYMAGAKRDEVKA